jgi:ribose 1,5-bisphosphate isomerase
MHRDVKVTISNIKSLKIQGARNVAKASLNALIIEVQESKSKNLRELQKNILHTSDLLAKSRPTEPMMRNLLEEAKHFLKNEIKAKPDITNLKKQFIAHEKSILKRIKEDKERLSEYGAKLIPNNSLILTHCHSSTATGILIKAKKMKKKFSVIACETRPRYQGRKTATELTKAGIDTTLVVDGAANMFMKKADMCLVGADSITARGDLINKVGTSMIAHIAKSHDVSFYSAAELLKFSPFTIYGEREKIEERSPSEVWNKPPKKLKIRNPSFDVTASSYISGFITEVGVVPPQSIFRLATDKLGIKIIR